MGTFPLIPISSLAGEAKEEVDSIIFGLVYQKHSHGALQNLAMGVTQSEYGLVR